MAYPSTTHQHEDYSVKQNQSDQVVQAVEQLNGIATLAAINDKVDVSGWVTKTPYASIRRIVQTDKRLAKLKPGLYCLREKYPMYRALYDEKSEDAEVRKRNHAFFQSILVAMAKQRELEVFVPPQDRNKEFLPGRTLADLPLLPGLPSFGYDRLMRHAQTVDVIWMNRRKMPAAWYEVEMHTDMRRSLQKFHELQDFFASMYIVAHRDRENEFKDKLLDDSYYDIRGRVKFMATGDLMLRYQSNLTTQHRVAGGARQSSLPRL